jgi:hypothetical protein
MSIMEMAPKTCFIAILLSFVCQFIGMIAVHSIRALVIHTDAVTAMV